MDDPLWEARNFEHFLKEGAENILYFRGNLNIRKDLIFRESWIISLIKLHTVNYMTINI